MFIMHVHTDTHMRSVDTQCSQSDSRNMSHKHKMHRTITKQKYIYFTKYSNAAAGNKIVIFTHYKFK